MTGVVLGCLTGAVPPSPQDEESARAPVVTVMDRLDVISVQSDASSIADSVASGYPGGTMQRLDEVRFASSTLMYLTEFR